MLRVCVIGMGPIGNLHADIYRADPLAELAGVCDIRLDRMEAASKRLGVPGFPDAETMLKKSNPRSAASAPAGSNTPATTASRPFRRLMPDATFSAKNQSPIWFPKR